MDRGASGAPGARRPGPRARAGPPRRRRRYRSPWTRPVRAQSGASWGRWGRPGPARGAGGAGGVGVEPQGVGDGRRGRSGAAVREGSWQSRRPTTEEAAPRGRAWRRDVGGGDPPARPPPVPGPSPARPPPRPRPSPARAPPRPVPGPSPASLLVPFRAPPLSPRPRRRLDADAPAPPGPGPPPPLPAPACPCAGRGSLGGLRRWVVSRAPDGALLRVQIRLPLVATGGPMLGSGTQATPSPFPPLNLSQWRPPCPASSFGRGGRAFRGRPRTGPTCLPACALSSPHAPGLDRGPGGQGSRAGSSRRRRGQGSEEEGGSTFGTKIKKSRS